VIEGLTEVEIKAHKEALTKVFYSIVLVIFSKSEFRTSFKTFVQILQEAVKLLQAGMSALDVVESTVVMLEGMSHPSHCVRRKAC
jgi:hypothetical protein